MRSRLAVRLGAPLAAAALVSGGLLAPATAATPTTHDVAVVIDGHGVHLGLPPTDPAGQYRFHISTTNGGAFQLARLAPGYQKTDLLHDFRVGFTSSNQQQKLAALDHLYSHATFEGGTFGTMPNEEFNTYLDPGRYAYLDLNHSNLTDPSQVGLFTLTTAGQTPAVAPRVNFIAEALQTGPSKFRWDLSGTLARSGVLRFDNISLDMPHFLEIDKLAPGKHLRDYLAGGNVATPVFATGVISQKQYVSTPYRLAGPGNYVLACFVEDYHTGVPHAFEGLAVEVHVA